MATPVPDAGVCSRRKVSAVGDLTDADFRGCRWIEGDPSQLRPGMFCGSRVPPGESWCEKHRGIVFGENTPAEFVPQDLVGRWRNRRGAGLGLAASRHEH